MKKRSEFPVDADAVMDKLVATARAYGVKGLAYDINKRYITFSNELREAEYAKLGFRTALDILEAALHLDAEEDAQIAARRVVEMVCEMLGFVAFQVPVSEGKTPDTMHLMAKLSREYSEHIDSLADAIKDGQWTRAELARCRRENRDLLKACLETDAHFDLIDRCLDE